MKRNFTYENVARMQIKISTVRPPYFAKIFFILYVIKLHQKMYLDKYRHINRRHISVNGISSYNWRHV